MKEKGVIADNGCPIAILDVDDGLKEAYTNYVKGTSEDYELISSGEGELKNYKYKYSIFFDRKSLKSFTISCKIFKIK